MNLMNVIFKIPFLGIIFYLGHGTEPQDLNPNRGSSKQPKLNGFYRQEAGELVPTDSEVPIDPFLHAGSKDEPFMLILRGGLCIAKWNYFKNIQSRRRILDRCYRAF